MGSELVRWHFLVIPCITMLPSVTVLLQALPAGLHNLPGLCSARVLLFLNSIPTYPVFLNSSSITHPSFHLPYASLLQGSSVRSSPLGQPGLAASLPHHFHPWLRLKVSLLCWSSTLHCLLTGKHSSIILWLPLCKVVQKTIFHLFMLISPLFH